MVFLFIASIFSKKMMNYLLLVDFWVLEIFRMDFNEYVFVIWWNLMICWNFDHFDKFLVMLMFFDFSSIFISFKDSHGILIPLLWFSVLVNFNEIFGELDALFDFSSIFKDLTEFSYLVLIFDVFLNLSHFGISWTRWNLWIFLFNACKFKFKKIKKFKELKEFKEYENFKTNFKILVNSWKFQTIQWNTEKPKFKHIQIHQNWWIFTQNKENQIRNKKCKIKMQIDKVHENTTKQKIMNLKENICQLNQHVKAFKIFMPLYKYVYFEMCQSWWTKHRRQRWKSNNFDFYMHETACTNLCCKLFSCKKRFHLAIFQLEQIARACFCFAVSHGASCVQIGCVLQLLL